MTFTEVAITNYPVTDLAAARAFYENVLGLKPSRILPMGEGHGWIEYEIGPHAFGVGKVEGWLGVRNCAFETDDFDAALAALRQVNTPFHTPAFETPICRMATIIDPGGNFLTIHQRKPGHDESTPNTSRGPILTEVAFTAYPANDLAASRAFYENVLGLKPATNYSKPDGSGWVEYELGSHTFGVGKSDKWNHGICCALETDNFDGAIETLRKAAATFHIEPFEGPICHMAMVADPAGNKLIIHQRKPRKA